MDRKTPPSGFCVFGLEAAEDAPLWAKPSYQIHTCRKRGDGRLFSPWAPPLPNSQIAALFLHPLWEKVGRVSGSDEGSQRDWRLGCTLQAAQS